LINQLKGGLIVETFHVRQGDKLEIVHGSQIETVYVRAFDKGSARLALDKGVNFIFQATGPAFAVKVVDGLKVSSPIRERETWLSKERYGYPSAVKLVHVASGTTVVITCAGCQNKTMRLELVFPERLIQIRHWRGSSWTVDELIK